MKKSSWKATVLTLFPEMFPGPLADSVLGKALEAGLWQLEAIQIRDFATDKHQTVDDRPFGGGSGMLMKPDVIASALEYAIERSMTFGSESSPVIPAQAGILGRKESVDSRFRGNDEIAGGDDASSHSVTPALSGGRYGQVKEAIPARASLGGDDEELGVGDDKTIKRPRILYFSPRGEVFNQKKAEALSKESEVILLCGRYEGIDERVIEHFGIEEVSLGDFVLSGGEIPAMAVIDACVRHIFGVIGKPEALEQESFGTGVYAGLLEYPHYTRPAEWKGQTVPEVLLSGNHAEIEAWRLEMAEEVTRERRKDLWERYSEMKAKLPVRKRSKKSLPRHPREGGDL